MVQVATETSAEALQVCAVTALATRLAVTPPAATRANTARATTRRRGLRIINCLSASLLTPMRDALTSAPVHICSNPDIYQIGKRKHQQATAACGHRTPSAGRRSPRSG